MRGQRFSTPENACYRDTSIRVAKVLRSEKIDLNGEYFVKQ